jgi:large subunit ribosomal protein L10
VAVLDRLEEIFSTGDGFVLMDNKGLDIAQMNGLRVALRAKGCTLKVAKNTLVRLALEKAGYDVEAIKPLLVGPTVIAVGFEDPITAAKVVHGYIKDTEAVGEKLVVKGGILEKKKITAGQVKELANAPGREELLSRLLGSMMAPAQNTVYALNAAVGKVVYATDAYRRKLEEGGTAAA